MDRNKEIYVNGSGEHINAIVDFKRFFDLVLLHFYEIKICVDKSLSCPLQPNVGIYMMMKNKIPYAFWLRDIWNCDVKCGCGHDKMFIESEHILTFGIFSVSQKVYAGKWTTLEHKSSLLASLSSESCDEKENKKTTVQIEINFEMMIPWQLLKNAHSSS